MVENQMLSSIAMSSLANSHVLNTEGEKMQFALGTLPGYDGPAVTIDEVLKISKSVIGTMNAVGDSQVLLNDSLRNILSY